jgi:uncharacterized protein (DUF849 family)
MKRREFIGAVAAGAGALALPGCASSSSTETSGAAGIPRSVEETPIIFEVAISGSTTKEKNPLVPESMSEMSAEMIACFDAGATIVHSHTNMPTTDVEAAARPYAESYAPVWEKHPHAVVYATANFDPAVYHKTRTTWPGRIQCGHQRILARDGMANMVLLDMGVVPLGMFDEQGVPKTEGFWWYGFWPDDIRYILDVCKEFGTGTSISVFEPGWMKNVVAMAKAGTIPRGSKLNIYFADAFSGMAPPIPEALDLYLKMIEPFDLKWSVGYVGSKSVMDTPVARLALERGGSFRVGLEDWPNGPSNLDQMARAKEMFAAVGRPVVTGAEAIEYLDVPYPKTRP